MAESPGVRTFDHVLLTRFSAILFPGQEAPTEDWLYYRLGFFLDACRASVQSQQGAEFQWLVMFDDRCSKGFRQDVEDLAARTFTPIWTHAPFRRDSFAEHVAARSDAPYLITTRIDSDDAIAVDFMASVQAQFAQQERMFINFPRGIQIDRTGAVYRSDILSSPFLSLIEKREEGRLPETVFVAKHARARGHAPLREVRAPVMWAQVLHGTNLSNIVNGAQISPKVIGERFNFELGYDATAAGGRLRRSQLSHLGRLASLWAAHPGELTKWAEATAWTLRGTHERPRREGAPTLSDAAQTWEMETRTKLRHWRWRTKARANEVMPGRERILAGSIDEVLSRDEVVILAEWSRGSQLRDDARQAAHAYAAAGLGVLVVAARDPWARLQRDGVPAGVAIARRPNIAYDFGSWAWALRTYPELATKDLVVLTNDSLVGPLGPLDELIGRVRASDSDVWSATANRRPADHLQSYLMAFRRGVLGRDPLKRFFAEIRPQPSKRDVVLNQEVGLSPLIDTAGLTRTSGWTHDELGLPDTADIPLSGWRQLHEAGFPFVKRTLLTHPHYAGIRRHVEDVIRHHS